MTNKNRKFSAIRWVCVFLLGTAVLSLSGAAETIPGNAYATWGITSSEVTISAGSVITEAVLTVDGVSPSNAAFEVYLLDNPAPVYVKKQKDMAGSVFAGYGARLTGTMVDGNYVCRLGDSQNNDSQSSVWNSFAYPFNFLLADGRTVSYTSSLLELIDYAGSGGSFGIGIESAQNTSVAFSSLTLQLTISSYQTQAADQILTFAYNSQSEYALQFDGVNDRVTLGGDTVPSNNFTVSAWVKTDVTHQVDVESITGVSGVSGQKYLFYPENMVTTDKAGMGISVGTNGVSVYEHTASYVPALAVYEGSLGTDWNYIAVTYTNKQPRIYVNGILVRTGLTSPKTTVYAPKRLGAIAYGWFKGEVSGVRIWDRSLSEVEVLASVTGDAGGVGPIGAWELDEGTGTTAYDRSIPPHNGTINGATWVTLTSVAEIGNALQFDGVNDRVTLGGDTVPSNNFTVSAWVKTDVTHQVDVESITGVSGVSGQKYLFYPENMVTTDKAGMGISVGTNGVSVYEHTASYVPALAVYEGSLGTDWNYIAVTYTNKQPRIYVNGILVRTGLTSPKTTVYAPKRLGAIAYGWFKGEVSGVRIWDRSLSEVEVLASVTGDAGGVGPIGAWELDEGAGTTAYDSSGNGYNGTINGATWVTGQ